MRIRTLCEGAIMVALATVLSMIKVYDAPLGGSVTLMSALPIVIISCRHGWRWGLLTGFAYGALQMLLGMGSFAYLPTAPAVAASVFGDYLLAFALLGLCGLFFNRFRHRVLSVALGILLGMSLRFICHFLVGALFWHEITVAGGWNEYASTVNAWLYSFVYNITYMGPELLITLAGTPVAVGLLGVLGKILPTGEVKQNG